MFIFVVFLFLLCFFTPVFLPSPAVCAAATMPGVLTEPQIKSEEEEEEEVNYCNSSKATTATAAAAGDVKEVTGHWTTSPSPTSSKSPDPGENGKAHSSTSDSGG